MFAFGAACLGAGRTFAVICFFQFPLGFGHFSHSLCFLGAGAQLRTNFVQKHDAIGLRKFSAFIGWKVWDSNCFFGKGNRTPAGDPLFP